MFVPLIPLMFLRRANNLYPDKVCVVDVGYRRLTYSELYERTIRLSNALLALDGEPGEVISLLCLNSHHVVESYYGIPEAGKIFNPISHHIEPETIKSILQETRTPCLIFHGSLLPLVQEMRAQLPAIKQYVIIDSPQPVEWATDYETFLSTASSQPSANLSTFDENSVAELFFRLDPFDRLKGVMLTHRALYLHALTTIIAQNLLENDVLLNTLPLFDVNGVGVPQTIPAIGGRMILMRDITASFLMETIQAERVTRLYVTPGLLNATLRNPNLNNFDLSSLVHIVVTASMYSLSLIEQAEELLNCRVEGAYGQLQTSPLLTYARAKEKFAADPDARRRLQATAGLPALGVTLRVIDQHGCDVPRDSKMEGEIVVQSNHVMAGYFNQPALTNQSIFDGWYHTGDLATINREGYITIVGEMPGHKHYPTPQDIDAPEDTGLQMMF